jgi:hypothetical protein
MNKGKDEDLDNLFKKRLEDPVNESTFRDEDWDAMEQMLDKGKKRPAIIYWLPVIGSAAALLLIFLGYLFFKPEVVKPTKQGQMTVAHRHNPDSSSNNSNSNKERVAPKDYAATNRPKKDNTGTSGEPARQAADNSKQQTLTSAKYAGNPARLRHGQKSKSFFTLSSGAGRRDTTGYLTKNKTARPGAEIIAVEAKGKNLLPDTTGNQAVIADNIVSDKQKSGISDNRTQLSVTDDKTSLDTADNKQQKDKAAANALASAPTTAPLKVKGKGPQKLGNRPQFALGVFASSDLNGVNSSFQQSKIGGNFGAVLSVTFAKKWTISAGAMYDIKPYLTSFGNYHTNYQFETQPSSVNANCRMLDIPLNINYRVYSQQANKITLGTGLSSYFMLREDYKFNYPDSYNAGGPSTFTVINKNRNILSVLNLDATFTHQINSKVGVTVQPYLKVPLSDVGASQVRLQSTGVALGLSWNLNASSKPK